MLLGISIYRFIICFLLDWLIVVFNFRFLSRVPPSNRFVEVVSNAHTAVCLVSGQVFFQRSLNVLLKLWKYTCVFIKALVTKRSLRKLVLNLWMNSLFSSYKVSACSGNLFGTHHNKVSIIWLITNAFTHKLWIKDGEVFLCQLWIV